MIPGMALIEDQLSFYNVRRSGNSYDAATLIAAIADIGSVECVAYLPKGMEDTQTVWTIDQNIHVPENISILIPCGVILQVNAGIGIVFHGPVFNQCPMWRSGLGYIILLQKTAINTQSYQDFFDPFVVRGGIHGLSPTCYSPNFQTEAYLSNGQYLFEDTHSIDYGALGANCLENWVWVIISGSTLTNIPGTNFTRVPDTHYYIDFTSTTHPGPPPNSAYLMAVHLQNDQIVQVLDWRSLDAAQGLLNRIPTGTWTPRLLPGNYSYGIQYGVYINLGKLIFVYGSFNISGIASYGTGNLQIVGLPYDYVLQPGESTGALTVHVSGNIKPLYGPGSFSASMSNTRREMDIVENVVGQPFRYVTADRVMVGTSFSFSGVYVLI